MNADPVRIALEARLAGDSRKAENLLLEAAESGNGHAAHELGSLYATGGPDLKRDEEKSRYWFKRALASGFEAKVATDPKWFRKVTE